MIRRGQIWWADLAAPRDSEPRYRHPVLVLQREEVNASRINTVVVCLLTTNLALARVPGNALLPRRWTGLRHDSVVNASQIATLNKSDLEEQAGTVLPDLMAEVDEGLRWFLDLA